MDYGQLIVVPDNSGKTLWRSHDHPYIFSTLQQLFDQQPPSRPSSAHNEDCHLLRRFLDTDGQGKPTDIARGCHG